MKLIIGDEFGLLKEVNTNESNILTSYGEIDPKREIISIIKSPNESLSNEKPTLFITELKETYSFDWKTKTRLASNAITNQAALFTSAIHKTIQGKHVIIASKSNNSLSILKYGDDYHLQQIDDIDNIIPNKQARLIRIEASSYRTNKEKEKGVVENIICLYEDAPLALYDVTAKQFSWKAKNVPNDELGLVVPMYDTNACQSDLKPSLIYSSTAYGEIRTYDINAKNAPVASVNVSQNKINKMILVNDTYIVIGDTKGYAAMFDVRRNMNLIRSFKGITSAIKDIVQMPNSSLIAICGYDRYLRWYDYTKGMNGHVYLKNKCTNMCFIHKVSDGKDEDANEKEEEEEELNSNVEEEEEDDQEGEENEFEEEECENESEGKIKYSRNDKTKRPKNESNDDDDDSDEANNTLEEYSDRTKKRNKVNATNKKQKHFI